MLAVLLTGVQPAAGQASDGDTQDLIRSAMVFNFCKFVQWPQGQTENDSLVLGIVSSPESAPDFTSIAGKTVRGLPITVRFVDSKEDIRDCHLVYIPSSQGAVLEDAMLVAGEGPILTISDLDDFCNQGGMIQLIERRGKLRFFINRQAAENSQLIFSSQLLKVAKIVEGS